MMKLKNKLGTRQLPTAELLIDGATAFKVSKAHPFSLNFPFSMRKMLGEQEIVVCRRMHQA